mmetsp:Transcript_15476/g.31412  ORF Transcript_15476/g.31412 Transcript_15476/m.31412 type:complete len:98 (+) Transcript_15476:218-511(+)
MSLRSFRSLSLHPRPSPPSLSTRCTVYISLFSPFPFSDLYISSPTVSPSPPPISHENSSIGRIKRKCKKKKRTLAKERKKKGLKSENPRGKQEEKNI